MRAPRYAVSISVQRGSLFHTGSRMFSFIPSYELLQLSLTLKCQQCASLRMATFAIPALLFLSFLGFTISEPEGSTVYVVMLVACFCSLMVSYPSEEGAYQKIHSENPLKALIYHCKPGGGGGYNDVVSNLECHILDCFKDKS
jgi:hypothetical protein